MNNYTSRGEKSLQQKDAMRANRIRILEIFKLTNLSTKEVQDTVGCTTSYAYQIIRALVSSGSITLVSKKTRQTPSVYRLADSPSEAPAGYRSMIHTVGGDVAELARKQAQRAAPQQWDLHRALFGTGVPA